MGKTIILLLMLSFVFSMVNISAAGTYYLNEQIPSDRGSNTKPVSMSLRKIGGDYSWNSSWYEAGVGGKETGDYALFIKTENYDGSAVGTDAGGDPFVDKSISAVSCDVTYEGSIMAPSEGMSAAFSAGINGKLTTLVSFSSNGYILINGMNSGVWNPGRWYRFAFTLYAGTCKGDFYMNGRKVAENADVQGFSEENKMNTFNRYKINSGVSGASEYYRVSNTFGVDNMKWYSGEYISSEVDTPAIACEDYAIDEDAKTVLVNGSVDAAAFKRAFSGSEIKVFNSGITAQVTGSVEEGCVLAAYSESGEVIEYYDVVNGYIEAESYYINKNEKTVENVIYGTPVSEFLNDIAVPENASKFVMNEKNEIVQDRIKDSMALYIESYSGNIAKYDIVVSKAVDETFEEWDYTRYSESNASFLSNNGSGFVSGGFPLAETDESAYFETILNPERRQGKALKFYSCANTPDTEDFRHFAVIKNVSALDFSDTFVTDVAFMTEDASANNLIAAKYIGAANTEETFVNIISFTSDGKVLLYGTDAAEYKTGKWNRYTVVTNVKQRSAKLYVDGVLTKSTDTLPEIQRFTQIRMQHQMKYGVERTSYFDNFSIYKVYSENAFDEEKLCASPVSSSYTVAEGPEPYITNIPSSLKTNLFLAYLLAENRNITCNVYNAELTKRVEEGNLAQGMILKTISPDGRTEKLYTIKMSDSQMFYEDFEDYDEGAFASSQWSIEEKADTGGKVEIVSDGGNKVFKNTVEYISSTKDSFIGTKTLNLSENMTIAFRIRNGAPTKGSISVAIRDNVNGLPQGSMNLISVGTKITYLTDCGESVSETYSGEWLNIKIEINNETGGITVYKNGAAAAQTANYRLYKSALAVNNCRIRFQSFVNASVGATAENFVDNVSVSKSTAAEGEMYVQQPVLYIKGQEQVTELRDGSYTASSLIENLSAQTQTAVIISAHKKNGILQNVYASSQVQFKSGDMKKVSTQFTLSGTDSSDELSVYVVDSLNNMMPLTECITYKKSYVEKPQPEDIERLFTAQSSNVHPRIMATEEDFQRILALKDQNGYMAKWYANVLSSADKIAENLTTENSNSGYYIGYVFSEGERLLAMARKVMNYATTLGMAYRLTGNTKYSDAVWFMLNAAGKPDNENPQAPEQFPDWHPSHYLDTAEMTAGFAIGYDWCYDAFSEEQRAYIRRSIADYGLATGIEMYNGGGSGTKWPTIKNNWNVVCNGGLTMGALAIADEEPELAFKVVSNAVNSLYYMLPMFAPDGAWYEGSGYWSYTVQYLAKMVSTLDASLGYDFGIMNTQGIDTTAEAIFKLNGPKGTNNFHDSGSGLVSAPEMFWLSNIYNKPATSGGRLKQMSVSGGGALDLLWYNPECVSKAVNLPKTAYFHGLQAVTMRSEWDTADAAWLSFHAGKATTEHSHLDCGSFVYDYGGVRWALDLGADSYTLPNYFSSNKVYYRTRAEGHNVPVINPNAGGGQDIDAETSVVRFINRSENPFGVVDLSSAYKTDAAKVMRGYMMADSMKTLVIRDEFELKNSSSIYWFMHTQANASVNEDNTVTLTQNGVTMRLRFVTDADSAVVSVVDAKPLPEIDSEISSEGYPNHPDQNQNSGVRKIMIKLKGSGNVSLGVQLAPEGTGVSEYISTPVNDWR